MKVFLSGDTHGTWQTDIMKQYPDHRYFDPRTVSNKTLQEMALIERQWIDESDILFSYLSKTNPYGFGTCFEIGYAVAKRKVIIYIDEKQVSSSQWLAQHPVYAYATLAEGIAKLADLLTTGSSLIAERIWEQLRERNFRVLADRELDDAQVTVIATRLFADTETCESLMLAIQTMPRQWYDWNLGYLLRRFDPQLVAKTLRRFPENFYASEGVAWALGLLGSDASEIVAFLQEQCGRCEDHNAWWCAAHSLQQLGNGDAIEILKRTLRGDEWKQLDHCLAHLGERPATIGILRLVNRANLKAIVKACIQGLDTLKGRRLHNVIWLLERMRLREKRIVDALMSLHDGDVAHGSSVAHRVIEALGQIAHPSSRAVLEQHLAKAEYFRTRALAARGLGMIGDYNSLSILEEALTRESDPHVIAMISEALYNIRDSARRDICRIAAKADWLENGMIIDETNKWYWAPDIYDQFSKAEDPESIAFDLAIRLINGKMVRRVLDIAAGTGRFSHELREKVQTIEAISALDASEDMIGFLKRRFARGTPKVTPVHGTIEAMPLADESIDLAVSSWGFPSKVWDREKAVVELAQVHRVLSEDGLFITIGWDEDFSDEMTEIWHRFVIEEDYYFDSLSEYRRRKRARITSPRNCHLSPAKRRVRVPVKFQDHVAAANVFGHLFGYAAGLWVLENPRQEFMMNASITFDTKATIAAALARAKDQKGA